MTKSEYSIYMLSPFWIKSFAKLGWEGSIIGKIRDNERHIYIEKLTLSKESDSIGVWRAKFALLPKSRGLELYFIPRDGDIRFRTFYKRLLIPQKQVHIISYDKAARGKKAVNGAKIIVIGIGAVGSFYVAEMAWYRPELWLIDKDVVGIENLTCQWYSPSDVGRLKVNALKDRLIELNPFLTCHTFYMDALEFESLLKLDKIISKADLVVCTADSAMVHRLTNYIIYRHRKDAIFPMVQRNGKRLVMITVRPRQTPCLECLAPVDNMYAMPGGMRAITSSRVKLLIDKMVRRSLRLLHSDFKDDDFDPNYAVTVIGEENVVDTPGYISNLTTNIKTNRAWQRNCPVCSRERRCQQ